MKQTCVGDVVWSGLVGGMQDGQVDLQAHPHNLAGWAGQSWGSPR